MTDFALRVLTAGLAAVLCVGRISTALGADLPPPQPVRISYQATQACPSADEFRRQVHARTQRADELSQAPNAWRFSVQITASQQGFSGQLTSVTAQGQSSERSVSGQNCEHVAGALALILALTIDPHASTAPASALAAPDPKAPQPAPQTPPKPTPRPIPAKPQSAPQRWSSALAIDSVLASNVSPEALIAFGPSLQLRPLRASLFPLLSVSLLGAIPRQVDRAEVSSRFYWFDSRWRACPLSARFSTALSLAPCVTADLGLVRVQGLHAQSAESHVRPWIAPGLSAVLGWTLSERWSFSLEAGPSFPLIRDRYYFRPDQFVHKASPVGLSGSFSMALRVW